MDLTLSRSDCVTLLNAITSLDGELQPVTDSDGKTQIIRKAYQFEGTVRLSLTKVRKLLKPVLKAVEEEQRTLQEGLIDVHPAPKKGEEPSAERLAGVKDYNKAIREFFQAEVTIKDVPQIDISDLKPETNRLPLSTLEPLLAIAKA